MHNFLNIYLREGDLIIASETPRDLPLCSTDQVTPIVVYTAVILVTSCIATCTLQTPGKVHMPNNGYSLLVPEVPFINVLHCTVFSVSGPNSVLQVQFALHYHHASLSFHRLYLGRPVPITQKLCWVPTIFSYPATCTVNTSHDKEPRNVCLLSYIIYRLFLICVANIAIIL